MANRGKFPACFLCLRNIQTEETNVGHLNCDSGDLLLLKQFLSWSLELPPAVIGDLLCTNVGSGGEHQGQGESLLCGSCKLEIGAACKLYQDLAKKLMELEEILENSVKKVSDKLKANLYLKVAKQLTHSRGSTKEGGPRVQRLRDLLGLKLATAKTKCIEDEVEDTGGNHPGISGSGTSESEIEDLRGVHNENRKMNEPETEAVAAIVKVESKDDEFEGSGVSGVNEIVEESERMDVGVAKENGGHRHRHCGSNSTAGSKATNWKENRGIVVEQPFTCLKCSKSFRDMDSVQRHQRSCKPIVSSSSGNGKPTTTPTTSGMPLGMAKMEPLEPGNGSFLRYREERSNSSVAAEAEDDADDDIPIQCLRCNDHFKTIQDFKKHQKWCKPLKVQDLKPGSSKEKLGRNSKGLKLPKTISCRFCNKTFDRLSHLKNHERIHTGEKPFKCTKCKRRFNRKSSCIRHLKICKFGRNRRAMRQPSF